jgi:biopolymer transport protein ExbB/TolQ
MPVLMLLLGVIVFAIIGWSIHYLVPITNRFFSLIWQDPSEKQRALILKRLKELMINHEVPEETAVLMAAKEFNATENEFLEALQVMKASEIKSMLQGKPAVLNQLLSGIDKKLRSGMNRRRR